MQNEQTPAQKALTFLARLIDDFNGKINGRGAEAECVATVAKNQVDVIAKELANSETEP